MEGLSALATWLTSVEDFMYEACSNEKNLEYYSTVYIQRGTVLIKTSKADLVAMLNP